MSGQAAATKRKIANAVDIIRSVKTPIAHRIERKNGIVTGHDRAGNFIFMMTEQAYEQLSR